MRIRPSWAFNLAILLIGGIQITEASTTEYVMSHRPQPPTYLHDYSIAHKRKAAFPASYDSREHGYDYPVRDQVIGGPCWAFAHTDAMRAGMNTLGCTERGTIATSILTNCHTYNIPHLMGGGNQFMAVSMIANLQGPVLEKDYPFSATDTLCPSWSQEDMYALPLSAAFLPKNDPESVKGAILEFGIITGVVYWDKDCYNSEQNLYCYTGKEPANHEICLVGWDDSKRAWLVRNSWGEDAHQEGHVWVSYDDVLILTECTCYYQMIPKSEIDQVYTYAESPSIGYEHGYPGEPIAGIVRFNAPTKQKITYVGTYTKDPHSFIQFSIYQGKDLLYQSKKEEVIYPSYTTFAVEEPITVKGDFYVRMEYSKETESGMLPMENLNAPIFNPVLHPGDQWIERAGEYDEAGESSIFDADIAIYAYTQETHPTIIWDVPEDTNQPILIEGKVNPEVWEKASVINVFNLAGQLVQIFENKDDLSSPTFNRSGVYLFQVVKQDNHTYTQKISLP